MASYTPEGQARKKARQERRKGVAALWVSMAVLGAATAYGSWANRLPSLPPEKRVFPEPNGLDRFLAVSWKLPPRLSPRDPFLAEPAALRKVVDENRNLLPKLHEAVALPFMSPLIRSNYRRPSDEGDLSSAGWLFIARARTELSDGRTASAMSWALDAVELGIRASKGRPATFLRPTWECSTWGTGMAEQCVPALTEWEADAAAQRVDRLLKQLPTFSEIVEEERRFRVATAHEALTRGVPDGMRNTAPGVLEPWRASLVALGSPKPVRFAAVEREYAVLAAYSRLSWSQRHRASLQVQRFTRERMDHVGDACAGREARLRLLRLELALHSQQRRTGTFPGTLQELQGLPDVTICQDPFAGGPLHYRRTKTGYRLYSCGRDGANQGGDPQRDLVAGTLANWREELSPL